MGGWVGGRVDEYLSYYPMKSRVHVSQEVSDEG